MMTARDVNGNRLFNSEEFLTSQQITSFFSCVAKKKKLESQDPKEDNDYNAEDLQNEIEELSDKTKSELSRKHPLLFDTYNICDLASKSKLETFAVAMLKQICHHFGIYTTDIKVKRKKPYTEKIMALYASCKCQV
jgi:Arf-GAP/Rho-GAP domain/ANK repeat/PH domain-containing protein 3